MRTAVMHEALGTDRHTDRQPARAMASDSADRAMERGAKRQATWQGVFKERAESKTTRSDAEDDHASEAVGPTRAKRQVGDEAACKALQIGPRSD